MKQKETTAPCCEEKSLHPDLIAAVNRALPPADTLYDVAELFRMFGDRTRIRILFALFEHEICVCDLAELLGMTVSAISHQLRILKTAGLVKYRRAGKTCYYALADDHVKTIIAQGIDHATEENA